MWFFTLFRITFLRKGLERIGGAWFERKREIFFKAQLYTDAFLRRKAVEKSPARINRSRDYSPPDNPPMGGFHPKERKCPKHGLRTSIIFTSATALLLRYVRVTYGKIAARQARGYGVLYKVKLFSTKVLFFIYSNSQQDTPLRPARCRKMTTAEC